MEIEKMSQFILQLRKEKGMTQKELAEHLEITDKAVSKWERGLSCPDITLLSSLADVLGVTTGELLNGQRVDNREETTEIVETTLAYANSAAKSKMETLRSLSAIIISGLFLCGMIVCIICDYAITGRLTWSWYPIYSILFAWILIIPLIMHGKKGIRSSLILLTIFIVPYFICINRLIGNIELFMPMSILIAIPSLVLLWLIYFIYAKSNLLPYASGAFIIIAACVVGLFIDCIVAILLKEPVTIGDIISYPPLIFLSLIMLVIGYKKYRGFRRK